MNRSWRIFTGGLSEETVYRRYFAPLRLDVRWRMKGYYSIV